MTTLTVGGFAWAASSARSESGPPETHSGAYADDFSSLSPRTRSYDDHLESIGELSEKLAPQSGSDAVHFAQLFTPRPPAATPPVPRVGPLGTVAQEAGRAPLPATSR